MYPCNFKRFTHTKFVMLQVTCYIDTDHKFQVHTTIESYNLEIDSHLEISPQSLMIE